MKKLYVRIQQRQVTSRFFRCGMAFTKDWQPVEVDAATAARLEAEQMLEVSEIDPEKPEFDAPAEAASMGGAPSEESVGEPATVTVHETPAAASTTGEATTLQNEALGGQTVPEDPAMRLAAIRAAIGQLNKEDATLWTAGGKPKTEAVAAITGWPVTAAERDAAIAEGEA